MLKLVLMELLMVSMLADSVLSLVFSMAQRMVSVMVLLRVNLSVFLKERRMVSVMVLLRVNSWVFLKERRMAQKMV